MFLAFSVAPFMATMRAECSDARASSTIDRGKFFIFPQEEVYAGQVVGEHAHEKDLVVNVTKSKKLTNMRASGSDEKARLIPPVQFSLEEALEYIKEDEYVEVTPKAMRMRKVILDETERKRANKS